MSDKPEALRLADLLEFAPRLLGGTTSAAAALLRRQHELADKYKWQVRDTCARAEKAEAERDHSRACYERACTLLHKIHALLYPPPVTLPDGRTMAFRPSSLDPHELFQELSDRIRALPDELAAIDRERDSLKEYGVITEFDFDAAREAGK